MNYFEILGVKRDASEEEIKKAYYELAMRYHPDHLPPGEREKLRSRFIKITKAYDTLIDDKKRKEYLQELSLGTFMEDRERERKEARKKMIEKGKKHIHDDPIRALKYFKMAYSLERTNQKYKSYYGLGLILTGREKRGIKLCKQAIEKKESPVILFNLAYGYAKIQKFRKAIKLLKSALRKNKNFKEARELLDELENKVGFKGFFNR